jgi:hypothetical protein
MIIRDKNGRSAQQHHLYPMLGLRATQHLPKEGLPPQIIQGIKVWVAPAVARADGRKSSTHRVLAECPLCLQVLSAGRLHQHVCKAARMESEEPALLRVDTPVAYILHRQGSKP